MKIGLFYYDSVTLNLIVPTDAYWWRYDLSTAKTGVDSPFSIIFSNDTLDRLLIHEASYHTDVGIVAANNQEPIDSSIHSFIIIMQISLV